MMNKIITTVTVVLTILMLKVESCAKLSDCPCNKVCADDGGHNVCRRGCIVFDKFVPMKDPGVRSTFVYGKRCNCFRSGGKLICTGAAWQGNPANVPEYEKNPKCSA